MTIPYQAIYPRVKKAISDSKNGKPKPNKIYARQILTKKPLNFDVNGKRALASWLNSEFLPESLSMTPKQSGAAERVRDLAQTVDALLNGGDT